MMAGGSPIFLGNLSRILLKDNHNILIILIISRILLKWKPPYQDDDQYDYDYLIVTRECDYNFR